MGRLAAAAVLAASLALSVSSCAEADITEADLYKIGCPAVDAVVGGGGLASKATVFGLEQLRESGQLGPEAQMWIDGAIRLLNGAKAEDLPADVRSTIVDGCADNGYPLRNLR